MLPPAFVLIGLCLLYAQPAEPSLKDDPTLQERKETFRRWAKPRPPQSDAKKLLGTWQKLRMDWAADFQALRDSKPEDEKALDAMIEQGLRDNLLGPVEAESWKAPASTLRPKDKGKAKSAGSAKLKRLDGFTQEPAEFVGAKKFDSAKGGGGEQIPLSALILGQSAGPKWDSGSFPGESLSKAEEQRVNEALPILADTLSGGSILEGVGVEMDPPVDLSSLRRAGVEVRAARADLGDDFAVVHVAGSADAKSYTHVVFLGEDALKSEPSAIAVVLGHEMTHVSDYKVYGDDFSRPRTELHGILKGTHVTSDLKRSHRLCRENTELCGQLRKSLRLWEDRLEERGWVEGEFNERFRMDFDEALMVERREKECGSNFLFSRAWDEFGRLEAAPLTTDLAEMERWEKERRRFIDGLLADDRAYRHRVGQTMPKRCATTWGP